MVLFVLYKPPSVMLFATRGVLSIAKLMVVTLLLISVTTKVYLPFAVTGDPFVKL